MAAVSVVHLSQLNVEQDTEFMINISTMLDMEEAIEREYSNRFLAMERSIVNNRWLIKKATLRNSVQLKDTLMNQGYLC